MEQLNKKSKGTVRVVSVLVAITVLAMACGPAVVHTPTPAEMTRPVEKNTVSTSTALPTVRPPQPVLADPLDTATPAPTATEIAKAAEIKTGMPDKVADIQKYPDWNTPDSQGRTGVVKYQAFIAEKILPAARAMNIDPKNVVPMGYDPHTSRDDNDPYGFTTFLFNVDKSQVIIGTVPDLPGMVMVTVPTKFGLNGEVRFLSLLTPLDKGGIKLGTAINSGYFNQPVKVSFDIWLDPGMPYNTGFNPDKLNGRQWIQQVVEQPVDDYTFVGSNGKMVLASSVRFDSYTCLLDFIMNFGIPGSMPEDTQMAMEKLKGLVMGLRLLRQ